MTSVTNSVGDEITTYLQQSNLSAPVVDEGVLGNHLKAHYERKDVAAKDAISAIAQKVLAMPDRPSMPNLPLGEERALYREKRAELVQLCQEKKSDIRDFLAQRENQGTARLEYAIRYKTNDGVDYGIEVREIAKNNFDDKKILQMILGSATVRDALASTGLLLGVEKNCWSGYEGQCTSDAWETIYSV